jgi:hypothetical protein
MKNRTSAIIYDCEIINCIPERNGSKPDPSLTYCAGWNDHANMGISCIGVYDYLEDRYRVFLPDNLDAFAKLASERDYVVGFNSVQFDDELCRVNGIKIRTTYDLLQHVRLAAGEPKVWTPGLSSKGFALDSLAQANLGAGKSGNGALAPELWQRGHIGQVIDYCLLDVQITRKLLEMGSSFSASLPGVGLKDPRRGHEGEILHLMPCAALVPDKPFFTPKARQG